MAELSTSPTTSSSSIELNDALFCHHGREVCSDCQFDGREDNNLVFGFDPSPRDPLNVPDYSLNKEGKYNCKKHGSDTCNLCYNWKKQISKLNKEAKKSGRKDSGSNFF
ncbi:hypothetical protein DACRYDRAFT_23895 [Dacryopinax primogenitus]|uniref:Uncharacterized protein n=1 Tax=Dacryopinax primogenitus (strain DJM 731) TaxID=1858805 RepID=M5FUV8_DACPD|nr:uncharacterized protein DACRYDRAFT_23895 [Dacryopinax primogenitus]EJT99309.1 hypothetical protein DACRYDRAFT_23895 [Dacryopinax primogenitus]